MRVTHTHVHDDLQAALAGNFRGFVRGDARLKPQHLGPDRHGLLSDRDRFFCRAEDVDDVDTTIDPSERCGDGFAE